MTVFSLLKADHKEVKEIFKELEAQESLNRDQVELLCEKLLLHMELEEKLLYPVLEEHSETEELGKEAELEHAEAKKFIRSLQKGDLDDTELKVKVEMLQAAIEHHVSEEEKELFPKAKEVLPEEQLTQIAEKMTAMKERKLAGSGKK